MGDDNHQLRVLAIVWGVFGVATALPSLLFAAFVAWAVAYIGAKATVNLEDPIAVARGFAEVLFGLLCIPMSVSLSNHRGWVFVVVMAALGSFIVPIGTVLGVLTLAAISRESTMALFARRRLLDTSQRRRSRSRAFAVPADARPFVL